MWSLDWFAARALLRMGIPVRRVAWERGTWLMLYRGVFWIRLPDLAWRVATAGDFAEAEFRARDWTPLTYKADVCGGLPAYNTTPTPEAGSWGDRSEMRPRPVPNFPEA
jgi:hypothetical protein